MFRSYSPNATWGSRVSGVLETSKVNEEGTLSDDDEEELEDETDEDDNDDEDGALVDEDCVTTELEL